MTENESKAIREGAAKSDMAHARKHGSIMIGQTAIGTVTLEYNREAKRYTVRTAGESRLSVVVDGKPEAVAVVIDLKAAACIALLAPLYVIRVDNGG